MYCWGGAAAETASSGKADYRFVTKVNLFYNGDGDLFCGDLTSHQCARLYPIPGALVGRGLRRVNGTPALLKSGAAAHVVPATEIAWGKPT